MRYWLFLGIAIIALVLVIFLPFNPPLFFGILCLAIVGEIWAIYTLIRLRRAKKVGFPLA